MIINDPDAEWFLFIKVQQLLQPNIKTNR